MGSQGWPLSLDIPGNHIQNAIYITKVTQERLMGVSKLGFTKKSNNDNGSTIVVENQDQIYIIEGKCVKE